MKRRIDTAEGSLDQIANNFFCAMDTLIMVGDKDRERARDLVNSLWMMVASCIAHAALLKIVETVDPDWDAKSADGKVFLFADGNPYRNALLKSLAGYTDLGAENQQRTALLLEAYRKDLSGLSMEISKEE